MLARSWEEEEEEEGGDVWKRDCAAFIEDSEGIVKPTVSGTGLG